MSILKYKRKTTETTVSIEIPDEFKQVYKCALDSIYLLNPPMKIVILFYLLSHTNKTNKIIYSKYLLQDILDGYTKATGKTKTLRSMEIAFKELHKVNLIIHNENDRKHLYYLNPVLFSESSSSNRFSQIKAVLDSNYNDGLKQLGLDKVYNNTPHLLEHKPQIPMFRNYMITNDVKKLIDCSEVLHYYSYIECKQLNIKKGYDGKVPRKVGVNSIGVRVWTSVKDLPDNLIREYNKQLNKISNS